MRVALAILFLSIPASVSAQRIPEHACGPISPAAWRSARKWIWAGGVKGINTPGVDSLRPLKDSTDKATCWAINRRYIEEHSPPRSIFRLGAFYLIMDVSMFEPGMFEPWTSHRQIYETDGTPILLDDTFWPLALGNFTLEGTSCSRAIVKRGHPGDTTWVLESPCRMHRPVITR